jgi:hypothetical protein
MSLNKTKAPYFSLMIATVTVFLVTAVYCAYYTALWGDEGYHTNVAISLEQYGDRFYRYFVTSPTSMFKTDIEYMRGQIITWSTSLAFKFFGKNLFVPRLVIIFQTALCWLVAFIYLKRYQKFNSKYLALMTILYFGNAFIWESSYYLRFYSLLNLMTLLTFIFSWETFEAYENRKPFLGKLSLSIFCILIPSFDSWQKTHLAALAIGIILLNIQKFTPVSNLIKKHQGKLKKIVIILILLAPYLTFTIDKLFTKIGMKMGSRSYMGYHHYYFDNILAIIRNALSANITLWVFYKHFDLFKKHTFSSIIFYSGVIISAINAVYNPVNHIYFTRYFLLGSALTAWGLPGVLLQSDLKKHTKLLVSIYLIGNLISAIYTYKFDRENYSDTNTFLNEKLIHGDTTLVADFEYFWSLKREIPGTIYVGNFYNQEKIPMVVEKLKSVDTKKILFFYYNEYTTRERIHSALFGDSRRGGVTISTYLFLNYQSHKVHESNLSGVLEFEKEELISILENYNLPKGTDRKNIYKLTEYYFKKIFGLGKHKD